MREGTEKDCTSDVHECCYTAHCKKDKRQTQPVGIWASSVTATKIDSQDGVL